MCETLSVTVFMTVLKCTKMPHLFKKKKKHVHIYSKLQIYHAGMLLSEQTHMVDLYIHDKVSKVQMALVICLT